MAASQPSISHEASKKIVDIESNGSTDIVDSGLEKVDTRKTSRSQRTANEREFAPIRNGDREELHRIASGFQRTNTGFSTGSHSSAGHDDLERKDTLAGIKAGDPVLDPSSPEFDSYKWARM